MDFKWILIFLTFIFLSFFRIGFKEINKKASPAERFIPFRYKEIELGDVQPKGWLLKQLQIMLHGTTGHLDEVHAKLRVDNGWMGGKGDAWEETPYWLDGALPLAWLVNDKMLKDKVYKYINWVLDNQRASGYFGPFTKWERETGQRIDLQNSDKGEDWWPKMIMLKVLQQFFSATEDKRVIPFMSRYFHYELKALDKMALPAWSDWATARGADNILSAQWLYGITGDTLLLELCEKIKRQAFPWSNWFGGRDWVINAAAQQNNYEWMQRHGVNVAMGLKDPIVNYQRTGDGSYLQIMETAWNDLINLHGLPNGMFSADEDLHGNEPTQGTELCAVVETMFSLEQAVAMTGNVRYMDALERIAFNALPAQTTDDFNKKQYFQIANQVQISRGVFGFSLPFERGMNNVLGMKSGYTCCLANMHQGWTKFASHLWYATEDGGLAALEYSPSQINYVAGKNKAPVTINEETNFPFEDNIEFTISTIKPTEFPLQLRIPYWSKNATVLLNGQKLRMDSGGQIINIVRTWSNGDRVQLQLNMDVITSNWGRNSRAVERGPLVYALKLEEKWVKASDEKEGDYYSVYSRDKWNYGLLESIVKEPGRLLEVRKAKKVTNDFIWNLSHVPMEIIAHGKLVTEWKAINGVAWQPVTDRTGIYRGNVQDSIYALTLVPYGFTKVRIVAFPVVR